MANNAPYIVQQLAGDQLEPWALLTAQFGAGSNDDIQLDAVQAGDIIFVAYRGDLGGAAAPTISDDAGNTWVTILSTNDGSGNYSGYWYCIAKASAAGNLIHFGPPSGNRGYHQAGRCLVIRNVQGSLTDASASGTAPGTINISLGGLAVSEALPSMTGPWTAVMLEMGGASGSVPAYVFASNVPVTPNPGPGSLIWADMFPQDDSFLNLYFVAPQYAVHVSDVVLDICERAGLLAGQVDVTLLNSTNLLPTDLVMGYVIDKPTPASTILKVLMLAYFFDACETNGTMKWVPRGLPPALTIPESDLGMLADMAKLVEQIAQEQDLPREFTVTHNDPLLDYQQNKQLKGRNVRIIKSKQQTIVEIPMTMTPDWARQTAAKALYLAWLERNSYKINLWRASYALLDPTDVIAFIYETLTFQMRVKGNTIGANLATTLEGLSEYAQLFISAITGGAGGGGGGPLQLVGPVLFWLFDIPLLRDVDSNPQNTGFYFAMSTTLPTFGGGILYVSSDDANFTQDASDGTPVTFGIAATTLAAPPRSPWIWDTTSTLTVNLQRGSFAGDTDINVLNGSNALMVGSELIQFANATQNADGSWTLSRLLRGRRGTEWACGTHAASELVIAPATGIQRVQEPLAVINLQRWFKGAPSGQDPSTLPATPFTIIGRDLMPYAPCHVTGARDGSNNLTINWIRRTRVGWRSLSQDPVPLSEDSESYSIDILASPGGAVKRTITSTSPTAAYTAAQQTTDFGSPQSLVAMNIYQVSAQVGRGFAKAASV